MVKLKKQSEVERPLHALHHILFSTNYVIIEHSSRMVSTRSGQKAEIRDEKAAQLRIQETEVSDSDSDDAPEEVGFVASKRVRLLSANQNFKSDFQHV